MNVLILTPDAVGSTLLQRLITIYMNFHKYDKPVINLHELTNGLVKYYNKSLKQDVLGKQDGQWGYHQTLKEIVDLLDSADHYKTSRLAQYHIKNRQDSLTEQIPFYRYLNDNFYIISCRRHNVFEHALSWALSKITKKLNVYSADEKIASFFDLYKNKINVDPESLVQTLETYKYYLEWCENHFNVASYFYYDQHVKNIESYILNLPIFAAQKNLISWNEQYGMEFSDWNRCHYLKSDIGTLALDRPKEFVKIGYTSASQAEFNFIKSYRAVADSSWPELKSVADYKNLPLTIRQEVENVFGLTIPEDSVAQRNLSLLQQPIENLLPVEHNVFLKQHTKSYQHTNNALAKMVEQQLIISPPPIKKQTLAEKKYLIKNFDYCLSVYNQWILNNPTVGNPVDISVMDSFADIEQQQWSPKTLNSSNLLSDSQTPD
jgi:hypothetical protein